MSVYKKLTEARVRLHAMDLKKSGENKFAGFKYFELGDFIPQTQAIFNEVGLCGYISFTPDLATLQIVDTEDCSMMYIYSPMAMANLKGAHDVQNLGATQTYLRRYLWVAAMELTESDWVDATIGSEPPPKPRPQPKPVELAKPSETPQQAAKPPAKVEGYEGDWQVTIKSKPDATPEEWISVAKEAFAIQLNLATSEDDLKLIYKKNRDLFKSAGEMNPAYQEDLVMMFKNRKEQING